MGVDYATVNSLTFYEMNFFFKFFFRLFGLNCYVGHYFFLKNLRLASDLNKKSPVQEVRQKSDISDRRSKGYRFVPFNPHFVRNTAIGSLIIITSILLILSIPVLARGITIIILDQNINSIFFNPIGNGNPVIFQHLF